MPALINVHAHMGYEGYTSWGAHNHTPQNLLDHLQREAYYGVAAATSVGSSPTEMSLQFQRDQRAGKFPPAAAIPVHARHGPAQWRPRPHPARGHRRAARGERGDHAGRGARGDQAHERAADRPPEDVGGRSSRHLSQAHARRLQRHRPGSARAQDRRARARHPARGPEGRRRRRGGRAGPHGPERAHRRGAPGAAPTEAAGTGRR